jgi:hypothetical protein
MEELKLEGQISPLPPVVLGGLLVYRFSEEYLYFRFSAMLRAWLENRLDPS